MPHQQRRLAAAARAALAALLACAPPAAVAQQSRIDGQSGTAVEPPPSPDAERATFTVGDGLEVNLFAAEPMVGKPIGMNFDPAGRLWVATSNTYPQVKPGQAPDDRVYVLEDADADGKADKSTVFADGLLIPTGVLPGDGGAYVANSTEVLHLADRDGDLKADDARVVLSGFGTEDTHHVVHSFRWDPDGRLSFLQGIYIHSNVETPYGRRTLNGSGTWRYRPENGRLDIFSQGLWNPWGHAVDRHGNSFQTDGAGSGGVHHVFPNAAFVTAKDAMNRELERKLGGMNEGSPKFCGAEWVGGRHLPDDWQNNVVTNDFRANRVARFRIEETPDGHFRSKPMPDVIKSSSRFFRPIDLKTGPDGAIYIADWCNQIINHGEVDFRDPRRDKGHGRIWRVTAKGRPLAERPKLVGATVPELLEHLKAPEDWTRYQARTVLRAKGKNEVAAPLAAFVQGVQGDDAAADALRLEALWVHQSVGAPEPALLARLLKSKDYRVRAAAVRAIPDWQAKLPDAMGLLEAAVVDESARVRLEAVSALAAVPQARSVEVAMRAAEKPLDPAIEFNLWRTANLLKDAWLPAFRDGRLAFGGRTDQMTRALQAVKSADAVGALVAQLKAGKVPADGRGDVFDLIAAVGGADDLRAVFDEGVANDGESHLRLRAIAALERAARQRKLGAAGIDAKAVAPLLDSADPAVRAAALRYAAAWKPAELRARFAEIAALPDAPQGVQSAAVDALAEGGPESAAALRDLAVAPRPLPLRLLALGALSRLDLKDASARAAELLAGAGATGGADPGPMLAAFLQREGGGDALAAALAKQPPPRDTARLALRYLNTSGRDAGALMNTVRTAAGVGATSKAPTPEEVQAIAAKVLAQGDAARGELVYRRADMGCANCHQIAGAGAGVGPDLRSIGASSPLDYVVEAILAPNKAVKEGYESLVVATKKGDVFNGIRVSKDDQQLVLRDATRDRIAIPVADIKRQKDGGSLMPAGLADALTEQELLDLCRFLAELGKPGAYAADSTSVVRRWRVLDGDAAARAAKDPAAALASPAAADALPWRTAYSLVNGALPADAFAGAGSATMLRAEFDVTAAGRVAYALNDAAGVTAILVDGAALGAVTPTGLTPALPVGRHAVTLMIDPAKRGGAAAPVRLELADAPGEAGRVQVLGGR